MSPALFELFPPAPGQTTSAFIDGTVSVIGSLPGIHKLDAIALILESTRRVEFRPTAIPALVYVSRRPDLRRAGW